MTSIGLSENDRLSIFTFSISKSFFITWLLTSRVLQMSSTCCCLVSQCSSDILSISFWSLSLELISSLIISWFFLSSIQVDCILWCWFFSTCMALFNSDLNRARVEQMLFISLASLSLKSSSESDSCWTSLRITCKRLSSTVLPRHISNPASDINAQRPIININTFSNVILFFPQLK